MATLLKHYAKHGFLPITSLFGIDQLDNETPTQKAADTAAEIEQESGWDRVKHIFELDEFDTMSSEAVSVMQVGALSMFIGALYGGVIHSRPAYMEFMRNNQATSFKNHLEAKRALQDKVTLSFGKGAFKWGWRLSLFSTSFVGISTIIQAYRGKCGILEYVIAGGTSGFLYKFNAGPRAWIVGGGLGSVLGLCCGVITIGLLKLTGVSMEEARYWQHYWRHSRDEYFRKGMADYLEKEDFAVIGLHNEAVGESGKDISNLDKDKHKANVGEK
ncbi:hypothetical protein NQ317_001816 [Molorchus minor]|uniref:Complex I assembly factor TIMMDC1, mitochondrial n=1 Tax=Molorchus minor TaxID=1323400 RepID=A0ABQ9J7E8_9CUCU|nr:hypothetical protein NQ317_001816 [Molorchus minor]